MVGALCFLHEDYDDDAIRTSSHVYTTIALSDTSTCILRCPHKAFSRRYVTLVFFALLFVARLKYRLISVQVSGGLELDCFPITRSKSTSLLGLVRLRVVHNV